MDNPFSRDYAEARGKFRAGATAAGAELQTFVLDHRGPDDLDLTTDTAWVGPRGARSVLVTVSRAPMASRDSSARLSKSSGCGGASPRPSLTMSPSLHIHAINPYGFSWLRRTNEDNVDINRNWMDFDGRVAGQSGL